MPAWGLFTGDAKGRLKKDAVSREKVGGRGRAVLELINLCRQGEVAVTQDYGVADLVRKYAWTRESMPLHFALWGLHVEALFSVLISAARTECGIFLANSLILLL